MFNNREALQLNHHITANLLSLSNQTMLELSAFLDEHAVHFEATGNKAYLDKLRNIQHFFNQAGTRKRWFANIVWPHNDCPEVVIAYHADSSSASNRKAERTMLYQICKDLSILIPEVKVIKIMGDFNENFVKTNQDTQQLEIDAKVMADVAHDFSEINLENNSIMSTCITTFKISDEASQKQRGGEYPISFEFQQVLKQNKLESPSSKLALLILNFNQFYDQQHIQTIISANKFKPRCVVRMVNQLPAKNAMELLVIYVVTSPTGYSYAVKLSTNQPLKQGVIKKRNLPNNIDIDPAKLIGILSKEIHKVENIEDSIKTFPDDINSSFGADHRPIIFMEDNRIYITMGLFPTYDKNKSAKDFSKIYNTTYEFLPMPETHETFCEGTIYIQKSVNEDYLTYCLVDGIQHEINYSDLSGITPQEYQSMSQLLSSRSPIELTPEHQKIILKITASRFHTSTIQNFDEALNLNEQSTQALFSILVEHSNLPLNTINLLKTTELSHARTEALVTLDNNIRELLTNNQPALEAIFLSWITSLQFQQFNATLKSIYKKDMTNSYNVMQDLMRVVTTEYENNLRDPSTKRNLIDNISKWINVQLFGGYDPKAILDTGDQIEINTYLRHKQFAFIKTELINALLCARQDKIIILICTEAEKSFAQDLITYLAPTNDSSMQRRPGELRIQDFKVSVKKCYQYEANATADLLNESIIYPELSFENDYEMDTQNFVSISQCNSSDNDFNHDDYSNTPDFVSIPDTLPYSPLSIFARSPGIDQVDTLESKKPKR